MEQRSYPGLPLAAFTFFTILSAGLLLVASFDVGTALLLTFVTGALAVVVALWLAPTLVPGLAGAFGSAAGFALTFAAGATTSDSGGEGAIAAALVWGVAALVAYSGIAGLAHLVGASGRREATPD